MSDQTIFPWNDCVDLTRTSPEARAICLALSALHESIEALRRDMRPSSPSIQEQTLRFVCEVHGLLQVAIIRCEHDAERYTREIDLVHRALGGGNCHAIINVEQYTSGGNGE